MSKNIRLSYLKPNDDYTDYNYSENSINGRPLNGNGEWSRDRIKGDQKSHFSGERKNDQEIELFSHFSGDQMPLLGDQKFI